MSLSDSKPGCSTPPVAQDSALGSENCLEDIETEKKQLKVHAQCH